MPDARRDYCCYCHLVVAPHDPARLERNGRAAHAHCVVNRGLRRIRSETYEFLGRTAVIFTAKYFAKEARGLRTREAMADLLARCLSMALAEPRRLYDTQRRMAVKEFAQRMSDRLFTDISVTDRPVGCL
jgi:hypothetical protein